MVVGFPNINPLTVDFDLDLSCDTSCFRYQVHGILKLIRLREGVKVEKSVIIIM